MNLEYFQLVTGVDELDMEKKRIVAYAEVPEQSTIFEGHFPGYPIMPGVLLTESMAQTSGYLLLALNGFKEMPFLAAIKQAKLRHFVEPKTRIQIEATFEHQSAGFAGTRARITMPEGRVADAELRFRTLPFPSEGIEKMVVDFATKVGLMDLVKKSAE